MTYYNENDPKPAAWLRELMAAGHIPAGVVDERSITEIKPHELTGYRQQHFFAGIGGWALALRMAGWPDDKPVRTGSCPCQPFSQAGQGKGEADERHLWPVFRDLITFGDSTVTFGEQVASKAGREWLAGIRADLEGLGYEVGAADLCAASAGAPHIRQRLFWVANANINGRGSSSRRKLHDQKHNSKSCGELGRMANSASERRDRGAGVQGANGRALTETDGATGGLADSTGMSGTEQQHQPRGGSRWGPSKTDASECAGSGRMGHADEQGCEGQPLGQLGAVHQGNWSNYDILPCTDGKARRVESGTFPLADGIPGRVGLLRGYGNAIVPEVAAEFVAAWDSLNEWNDQRDAPI